jgi:serine/threonine protein kinase
MAPEVMFGSNHSYSVDFFALGVMVFEMIIGKRPYYGKTRKEIKDKIVASQAFLKPNILGYSDEIISFVNLVRLSFKLIILYKIFSYLKGRKKKD